jgi:hypothetical protein
MTDKDIIQLPDGRKVVTTPKAAKRLKVISRRVLQFIGEGRLESVQIEEGGKHYVLLESLEAFEKIPRQRGRPKVDIEPVRTKPKAPGKKAVKKRAKK